jgi:murein DD-endopeptidase MepM/ murein hydrolase activator NlpD
MSFRTILVLVGTLCLGAGTIATYLVAQEPGPLVTIHQPTAMGGHSFTVDVSIDTHGSRLGELQAWVEQGGRRRSIPGLVAATTAAITQETRERVRITQTIATASVGGLTDGPARLIVAATRPVLFGLRHPKTEIGRDVQIRLTPPSLTVVSTHHYVTLGGAEMVVYRVVPPDSQSGVMVGDQFFKGYPAAGIAGGPAGDPSLHVAFFALGFDKDVSAAIRLTATDAAGNTTTTEFPHRAFSTTFSESRVSLNDRFLVRVVPPIITNTPGLSLPTATADERLRAFLHINGEVRRQNSAAIAAAARETSPEWLARGAFTRIGRAKSEAPFAERRTYIYNGTEVDAQVHLGLDLASTRHAAVTASNSGRVILAGYLGIYGNCIVIDHGMGVQSLYGHLSVMEVEPGDRVEKGEVIGRSGTTGIAGGDHVHVTMLVGGTPVNPIEWWDPHWIRDRIERKLLEARLR